MGVWRILNSTRFRLLAGSAAAAATATYEEIDRFLRPLALADVEQMTLSPRVYQSEIWQLFLIADV
jgi:hypothetical protein